MTKSQAKFEKSHWVLTADFVTADFVTDYFVTDYFVTADFVTADFVLVRGKKRRGGTGACKELGTYQVSRRAPQCTYQLLDMIWYDDFPLASVQVLTQGESSTPREYKAKSDLINKEQQSKVLVKGLYTY